MVLDHIPIVDYEAHPAFVGSTAYIANADTESLMAAIDMDYNDLRGDAPTQALQERFDNIIGPKFDALLALLRSDQVSIDFSEFLTRALAIARMSMRNDLRARARTVMNNSAAETLQGRFQDALALIRRDGFCQFRDTDLARRVWARTKLERTFLKIRARKWPSRHSVIALHPNSPGSLAIQRAAEEDGLRDFVSAYLGKPTEFYYAALDYAHPGQDWYKACYADVGLPTAKTVYMHFDADCDIVKAMFYLQDVDAKDGPFRFVRGSHLWQRSPLACAVQKGFDEASHNFYQRTADQIDYIDGYYRPRFKEASHRADMLTLPPALRGSTHFGDDLLDGSFLSETLLAQEHSFIAPGGTIVVFDGSRGIHRGSQVEVSGQRWAIQLAFRVCRAPKKQKSSDMKERLRGKASWLKKLAHDFFAMRAED